MIKEILEQHAGLTVVPGYFRITVNGNSYDRKMSKEAMINLAIKLLECASETKSSHSKIELHEQH